MRRTHSRFRLAALIALALLFFSRCAVAFAVDPGVQAAKSATVAIRDASQGNVGSGVVVVPGYVLTARHVAEAGSTYGLTLVVALEGGEEFSYEVVKLGSDDDLALLKVEGLTSPQIAMGDSAGVSSGDEVYTLGFPLGSDALILSKGIVSTPAQRVEGREYIQTDATINPGNSGGPLVDVSGRLIGINVAKISSTSVDDVGFAIPLGAVSKFLEGTPAAIGGATSSATATGASPAGPVSSGGGGMANDSSGMVVMLVLILGAAAVGFVVYSARRSSTPEPPLMPVPESARGAAAEQGPMLRYSVVGPGGSSEGEVALPAVFGRGAEADVRLSDDEVSRAHARVSAGGERFVVTDLGSRNGLSTNGRTATTLSLAAGEEFVIGRTSVRLLGFRKEDAGGLR